MIEANNFNEGTTIASIADMNDMLFQGRVDESEVGKIKRGHAGLDHDRRARQRAALRGRARVHRAQGHG